MAKGKQTGRKENKLGQNVCLILLRLLVVWQLHLEERDEDEEKEWLKQIICLHKRDKANSWTFPKTHSGTKRLFFQR